MPSAAFDESEAFGVSADGSVIVGIATNSAGDQEAFMWTSGGGMVGLGFLPSAASDDSEALGVSADGSVIVGIATNSAGDQEAFMTILIRNIPVGGTLIPIDSTSLILAGSQMTASWLIPVLVAGAGVGLVLVSKKSKFLIRVLT